MDKDKNKLKNLQLWCKKMTEGYRDVEIKDMSTSWKSGLAFCAIIHRFRPDLIDYESLSKENVLANNQLAFETAERKLGIPSFLDADDMVKMRVPDRLCVITYVSEYYNYFHSKTPEGAPGVNKFTGKKDGSQSVDKSSKIAGVLQPQNIAHDEVKDTCLVCKEKVYVVERRMEKGNLYHRKCFMNLLSRSDTGNMIPHDPIKTTDNNCHTKTGRTTDTENGKKHVDNQDSGVGTCQKRATKTENKSESQEADATTIHSAYADNNMKESRMGCDISSLEIGSKAKNSEKYPDGQTLLQNNDDAKVIQKVTPAHEERPKWLIGLNAKSSDKTRRLNQLKDDVGENGLSSAESDVSAYRQDPSEQVETGKDKSVRPISKNQSNLAAITEHSDVPLRKTNSEKPNTSMSAREAQFEVSKPPNECPLPASSAASSAASTVTISERRSTALGSLKCPEDITVRAKAERPSSATLRLPPSESSRVNRSNVETLIRRYESEDTKSVQGINGEARPKSVVVKEKRESVSSIGDGEERMSTSNLQQKLKELDSSLKQLEADGRKLEVLIRKGPDEDEDELMIAWLKLVTERNELVRQELYYNSIYRQRMLEKEQNRVDQIFRLLDTKPELTEEEKQKDEALLNQHVGIVNQRNEIVDMIEEERQKEIEEDIEFASMQAAWNKTKKIKKKKRITGVLRRIVVPSRKKKKNQKRTTMEVKQTIQRNADGKMVYKL